MFFEIEKMNSLDSILELVGRLPDVVGDILQKVGWEHCMHFIQSNKQVHKAVWGNFYYMRVLMAQATNQGRVYQVPNFSWSGGGASSSLVDNRFFALARLPLTEKIMQSMHAPYMQFMHRYMHLRTLKGCGICDKAKEYSRAYWQIGTGVCHECRCTHFVSDRRLHDEYGLRMTSMVSGRTVMQWIAGVVCVVRIKSSSREVRRACHKSAYA